jgi:hypothetical protein
MRCTENKSGSWFIQVTSNACEGIAPTNLTACIELIGSGIHRKAVLHNAQRRSPGPDRIHREFTRQVCGKWQRPKVGKVVQDRFLGHTGSKILQHIVNRDAHSADASLATALRRLDRDDVLVTDVVILKRGCGGRQEPRPYLTVELLPAVQPQKLSHRRTRIGKAQKQTSLLELTDSLAHHIPERN